MFVKFFHTYFYVISAFPNVRQALLESRCDFLALRFQAVYNPKLTFSQFCITGQFCSDY
jgi:hypothetical protein